MSQTNEVTQATNELPRVLTTKEVADFMRVSEDTVRNLAEQGQMPGAFRVGAQWRFHREKVLQMTGA